MSIFILYSINKRELNKINLANRLFFIFYGILLGIFGWLGLISDWNGFRGSYFFILIFIWIVIFFALSCYSRRNNKKLNRIGELTISMEGIHKVINREKVFFDHDKINSIKIRSFLLIPFFPVNIDGTRSYLITIDLGKSVKEELIISSQSVDKPETNFKDVIKGLSKRV